MRKELMIAGILLVLITLVSTTATTEFTYDFNSTFGEDTTFYYTESVALIINTPYETECLYTVVEGSTPSNEFGVSFGTRHEKTFNNLDEGLHKYYIQCENTSTPIMEVQFRTKKEVSANIQISEDSPLKDGTYDIVLVTSKEILDEPILEYSYDGTVYNPLPLAGSGTTWSGSLIISENIGEVIGSFAFRATDLEGREGTTITGDKVFIVDTVPPKVVQNIDATGFLGEIKLSWFLEEDVREFNIYRSESPGVDFTDFHDTVDDQDYTDTGVGGGRTYYYKVAGVDDAGNIAGFSREVSATALLSNTSVENNALNVNLLGKVDNTITQIDLLLDDIQNAKNAINLKNDKEQEFFKDLELDKEYGLAESEANSLKRDVERYKLQDLSETELDKKLNSAEIRIDIIKKRVPESITLIDENIIKRDLSRETITEAVLEYGQDTFTEREIDKSISLTEALVETHNIQIESELYNLEILYLDGTRKDMSLFKDKITSTELARDEDKRFILVVPKEIAERASELSFGNLNFEVIKDDPVLAFDADVNTITYTLDKHTDTAKLQDITISVVHKYTESEDQTSLITGFAIADITGYAEGNIAYILLGIVLLVLMLYFIYIKRKGNEGDHPINEKIQEAKEHKKNNDHVKLKKVYEEIQKDYKTLPGKEKKKHYRKIKKLHEA